MNTASNTRLRLTTQVGQDHAATRVLLDLGTNNQPHRPENAAEHKLRALLTYTGQTGEHHRSDRSLLVKPGDFHRTALTPVRPVWHTGQTGPSQKAPKHQTVLPSSKTTQTRNSSNTGQKRTHPNVHLRKNPTRVAPVRPVWPGLLWMNSTHGSTPLNPTPDLSNRSTDLRKTLGIVGIPHGESIAKFMSTKLAKSRGIEEIPPRTPLTLEHQKPQNRAPLLTDLGGESKRKEPRRVHTYTPTKSPRERSRKHSKKSTKRGLRKSPQRTNGNNLTKP
jgi:hypothetical protein